MSRLVVRRLLVAALSLVGVAGAAVALSPAATAAPAFTATNPQSVVGDVTGDRIADRVTLGYLGQPTAGRCAIQLAVGRGRGVFAAPAVLRLPVQGDPFTCPDLAVVVPGPTPSQNRLAVTFFQFAPADETLGVQLFGVTASRARFLGSFAGMSQPSVIGTQDLDGDGWGDVWESTDQGSGFQAYVSRTGTDWHLLYGTPSTSGAIPQFVDFNHAGGTDILVTWFDSGQGAGAAVVDGRTGAVQTLGTGVPDDPTTFDASVVDLDHDAYLDIALRSDNSTGVHTTYFRNRSAGGRWWFQPLPVPGT